LISSAGDLAPSFRLLRRVSLNVLQRHLLRLGPGKFVHEALEEIVLLLHGRIFNRGVRLGNHHFAGGGNVGQGD
jgi:hypothetical protein